MKILQRKSASRIELSSVREKRLKLLIDQADKAMQNQKWAVAAEKYQLAISEFGRYVPIAVWISLARSLRQQTQYLAAEETIGQGLKIHKNYIGLLTERAEISSIQQDWPIAIKRWRYVLKKIKDRSRLAAVYARLATAYYKIGDYQNAWTVIEEGLKYHPKHLPIRITQAEIAADQQNWPKAIKLWRKINQDFDNEKSPDTWLGQAITLRKSGDFVEANKVIQQALKEFPKDVNLLIESAEISNSSKDLSEAFKRWGAAQKIIDSSKHVTFSKKIYVRFNNSVIKRIANINKYKADIKKYDAYKQPRKYAIYTSFTGDYDVLKLPEIIDNRFDYIVYTDEPVDGMGIYKILPLAQPGFKNDGSRASRYPKTHPHILLKNYDAAIWVDTSLMISGDLMPILNKFLESGKAIASATHPSRSSLSEELQACIDLKKDNPKILKKQVSFYKRRGYDTNDLSNNGVLMFNLKSQKLAPALELWWDHICRFSKRDQLSFNYALDQYGVERYRLTTPPEDIRNTPEFIFVPHHTKHTILSDLYKLIS